ncbi:MAG: hypothetical protein SGBAC_007945 [Bacillariaceae sp.]
MGRGMLLDFDDDDLSECSDDDQDLMWDTDSTSTDSFYAHNLLGAELPTIWELETYASSERDEDDDIASIESEGNDTLDQSDLFVLGEDDKTQMVSDLPCDLKEETFTRATHDASQENADQESIDSGAGYEELWHVDENGEARKSAVHSASSSRDARRREIQAKMRVLEERISVMRGIAAAQSSPATTKAVAAVTSPKKEEKEKPPRTRRRGGRKLNRGRSRSRSRSLSRSVSPPRTIFHESLETRRKQVALARQRLQDRLPDRRRSKSPPGTSSTNKEGKQLTNPRHLHRQMKKRMGGPVDPRRFRTI